MRVPRLFRSPSSGRPAARRAVIAVTVSCLFHVAVLGVLAHRVWDQVAMRARFLGAQQSIQLEMAFAEPAWQPSPPEIVIRESDSPVIIQPRRARIARRQFTDTAASEVPLHEILAPASSVGGSWNTVAPPIQRASVRPPPIPHPERSPEKRGTQRMPPVASLAQPPGTGERTPPRLLGNAPPHYPQLALAQRWQGTVLLRVTIGRQGQVIDVRVARSSGHAILDGAAVTAVRRWRGEPAYQGGVAVSTVEYLPVQFELP